MGEAPRGRQPESTINRAVSLDEVGRCSTCCKVLKLFIFADTKQTYRFGLEARLRNLMTINLEATIWCNHVVSQLEH